MAEQTVNPSNSNTPVVKKETTEASEPVKKATHAKAAPKKAAVKKKSVTKKTVSKKTAPKKPQVKKAASKKTSSTTKKAGNFSGTTTQTMEKMMSQGPINFDKFTQGATEMGRENVEAMIQSGTVFAQGFENIMRTAMTFMQDSAEKQGTFMKEVMATKTLNEFTEAQNKMVQANFDNFMSNTTKLTEMSVKTLNEAVEPINTQVTKGMQQAQKMAA